MSKSNETNILLIILSVLFPLVGFVLYFVKKDDSQEVAKNYLYAAIAGFVVGLLLILA